jgi:hypothetical protein
MPTRTEDATYRRNREALRAKRLPCWLCGKPIRYDLKPPEFSSFSADHVDPVGRGGHNHGELRAAHLGCNKRRGKKSREASGILRTSREW